MQILEIDGDGNSDIVLFGNDEFHVLYADGSQGFLPAVRLVPEVDQHSIRRSGLFDVDSDGDPDFWATRGFGRGAVLFRNDHGTYTETRVFAAEPDESRGAEIDEIAWIDIAGDGFRDFVTLTEEGIRLHPFESDEPPAIRETLFRDYFRRDRLAVSDIDEDEDEDLLLFRDQDGVYVFKNNEGTLNSTPFRVATYEWLPGTIFQIDVDGDGKNDWMEDKTGIWLRNVGDGRFNEEIGLPGNALEGFGTVKPSIAVLDWDGDGDQDVFKVGSATPGHVGNQLAMFWVENLTPPTTAVSEELQITTVRKNTSELIIDWVEPHENGPFAYEIQRSSSLKDWINVPSNKIEWIKNNRFIQARVSLDAIQTSSFVRLRFQKQELE